MKNMVRCIIEHPWALIDEEILCTNDKWIHYDILMKTESDKVQVIHDKIYIYMRKDLKNEPR